MNCFVHPSTTAVGVCAVCNKAVCRACVASDSPRVVCTRCVDRPLYGFEYRSELSIGSWPLIHVCSGVNPVTGRPKVARGVIAIGNIAVGGLALGGVAFGLAAIGGLSVGLLLAFGGAALGVGLSFGGLAVGTIAVGGLAVGFSTAVGGAAFGPSVIDGRRCDQAALELMRRWAPGVLPPHCR
jgi:hypothetical protein